MSTKPKHRAQRLRIARLLGTAPDRVAYLDELPLATLRRLREQLIERQTPPPNPLLTAWLRIARRVPAKLAAPIIVRRLRPNLAARLLAYVAPERAAELARVLPAAYAAGVAAETNPMSIAAVVAAVPPDVAAKIAMELAAAREHVVMGRFVGALSDAALDACMDALAVPDLLTIAFVMEHKERLDEVVGRLSRARLRDVITTTDREDLWPETLELLDNLSPALAGTLADIAAEQGDQLLTRLVDAVTADQLWGSLLALTRGMQPASRVRFSELPALHDPAVLEVVIRTALAQGLMPEMLPLIPLMPAVAIEQVGRIAATLSRAEQQQILDVSHHHSLWRPVLIVLAAMPPKDRDSLAGLLLDSGDEAIAGLWTAASNEGLWAEVVAIGIELPRGQVAHFFDLVPQAAIDAMLEVIGQSGAWGDVLRVLPLVSSATILKLGASPIVQRPASVDAVVRAAVDQHVWPELLTALPLLTAEARASAITTVTTLDPDLLCPIVSAVVHDPRWPQFVSLIADLPSEARRPLARILAEADEELLDRFLATATDHGLWPQVVRLIAEMPPDQLPRVADRVSQLAPDTRHGLALEADTLGISDRLGPVVGVLVTA